MKTLEDRPTFMKELFEFLQARGIPNPKVPMIGGKELDLFILYNGVIARGGAENVSNNKLWKEIVNEFDLPASCTSASFTLKNHYQKYLLAFEQKFFFKKEDPEMLTELANQRKKLKEGQHLLKREEPSTFQGEGRSDSNYSLRENLLRAYGDKVKSSEELYCVSRNSLVPSANEIKRIILTFECLIPAELRYALNSLLMYSCSKVSLFSFDNYRVLYNSFEGYFLQVEARLRRTRYFLSSADGLRDERLVELDEGDKTGEEGPTLPVAELLEQFKLMLAIIRNLLFSHINDDFFSKDSRLSEFLFSTFIHANEGEMFRLSLEIFSVLSRYLVLKTKKPEEEQLFMDRLIDSLFSENECELAIETLHNLMMNQENEAVIESQLPRFVEILIRLLISGTVEIVERVLEIICYFSDLKITTRMLLARQPNFFPRLIALIAGRPGSNEKIARVSLMIINNIIVTAAARVYLKPLEKEMFLICSADETVSESLCQIIDQLKDDKEKELWKAHNKNFYQKYLKEGFTLRK